MVARWGPLMCDGVMLGINISAMGGIICDDSMLDLQNVEGKSQKYVYM